jgi:hypothetical protein
MFGSENVQSVVVSFAYDPNADEVLPLFRAPAACEIISASATIPNDLAAGTDNYFTVALRNGGSAGTATTAMAAAIGGTAGWTGLTPKAFTISEGTLAAGDVVTVSYDETGTGTFTALVVQLNYVLGVGA